MVGEQLRDEPPEQARIPAALREYGAIEPRQMAAHCEPVREDATDSHLIARRFHQVLEQAPIPFPEPRVYTALIGDGRLRMAGGPTEQPPDMREANLHGETFNVHRGGWPLTAAPGSLLLAPMLERLDRN
jgi:hypothetical protein